MNDENKETLYQEIQNELNELKTVAYGSEAYKIAVDGITKLMDKSINYDKNCKDVELQNYKIETDNSIKREQMKLDEELKREQMKLDEELKREQMKLDEELKREQLKLDEKFKQEQLNMDRKDKLISSILTGVGIGLPALLTIWGTYKTLKFEETGSVTTIMGRGFVNKLLPKK